MNRIAGTGLAAGALVVAGGTPIALLAQGAASASPLGATSDATSNATAAEQHLTDADETTETANETTDETTDGTEDTEGVASALGQAHAAAMKIWANCVGDAASGPKTEGQPMPPKTACGVKPLGPGQLMHQVPTTTVPVPTTANSTEPGDTDSTDTESSDAKPEYEAPHADDSTAEHSGDSSWSGDHSDSTEDSGDQESGQTASSDHESGHDD